jgi:hypothetical protein
VSLRDRTRENVVAGITALVALGLAAGPAALESVAGKAQTDPSVVCKVFHRTSPASALRGARMRISASKPDARVPAGRFIVRASLVMDVGEGRSLLVDVVDRSARRTVTKALYQFGATGPLNQFLGGHGFTGLVYVYLPKGHELQYFCARARRI